MKRRLSEEERRLWLGAMRAVRPLRRFAPETAAAGAFPSDPPNPDAPPARFSRKPEVPALKPRRVHNADQAAAPPLASLARRDQIKLARGRSAIDARLDLHGLTQAQAHAALLSFLRGAQETGARTVLVITGTGARGSTTDRGVLRRQTPLWLGLPEFRRYVVGFASAHVAHGGEGALYVQVRRKRQ